MLPGKIKIGMQFGQLTVLSREGSGKHKEAIWLCRCTCGGETLSRSSGLLHSGIQSCGCLRQANGGRPAGVALTSEQKYEYALRLLERTYKSSAKKRGLIYTLDRYEFEILIQQPCWYCGLPPSKTVTQYDFRWNGLDRIDPLQGYISDNILPCCWDCNGAKRSLPQEMFFDLVRRIYERHCLVQE